MCVFISFLCLPVIIQNPELFSKTLVIWLVIIGKGQLVECDNTCDLSVVIGNNNKKVSSNIYLLTAHSSLRIFQIMLRLQTSTKNMNFDTLEIYMNILIMVCMQAVAKGRWSMHVALRTLIFILLLSD